MSLEDKDKLTHLDAQGKARMVDVGDKEVTSRRAFAYGEIRMSEETLGLIVAGDLKKGDALGVARIAGIMAAKKTHDIIPLCHPLNLSYVNVELTPRPGEGRIEIQSEARCDGKTGVEMEALTAVSASALTLYDMVKAVDKRMEITNIILLEKSGGRSGHWQRA